MTKKLFSNNPKIIQVDCKESKELDLSQANAILEYRPDIILLEYPNNEKYPDMQLNKFGPNDKPKNMVDKRTADFPSEVLKIHPWVVADTYMWRNIAELWVNGHQVLTYPTDGPSELTSEWLEVWNHMYPQATKNWVWWVQIYLRERLMANNIDYIMHKHSNIENPTVLVFLQGFHWKHVKFLLSKPRVNEIWEYYFGKFSNEINMADIAEKIKKLNPVFYRYWKKYSDFK